MSKYDAERALAIYKLFSKQTNQVVEFLSLARRYESSTRLEIPKLKHAPTSLTTSLEEYLNDPDFEINRRQYLAQQDTKKGRKPNSNGAKETSDSFKQPIQDKGAASQSFPEPKPAQTAPAQQQPRGPAPDLIDFFASIEENQQPMAAQSSQQQIPNFQHPSQFQQQQSGFPYQQSFAPLQQQEFVSQSTQPQQQYNGNLGNSSPFGQIQPQQPQQGFGAYSHQPLQQQFTTRQAPLSSIQQELPASNPQQQLPFSTGQQSQEFLASFPQRQQSISTGQHSQATNPFRQSLMATGTQNSSFTSSPPVTSPASSQSTNPFAKNVSSQFTGQTQATSFTGQSSPFSSPPPMQTFQQPPAQPLQSMRTGTNPFARNVSPPQPQQPTASPLAPNPTGSTNPFRQSMFVNQQTGQGWQQSPQGTMGGLEQLDTVPVFPRPGQQPQTQQQPWL